MNNDINTYVPFACQIFSTNRGITTKVTFTTDHAFVVGNTVKFYIPPNYGIVQLDGLVGTVVDLGSDFIFVDIDSRKFNQFAVPTPIPFVVQQTPQCLPYGNKNFAGTLGEAPLFIPGAYRVEVG